MFCFFKNDSLQGLITAVAFKKLLRNKYNIYIALLSHDVLIAQAQAWNARSSSFVQHLSTTRLFKVLYMRHERAAGQHITETI